MSEVEQTSTQVLHADLNPETLTDKEPRLHTSTLSSQKLFTCKRKHSLSSSESIGTRCFCEKLQVSTAEQEVTSHSANPPPMVPLLLSD